MIDNQDKDVTQASCEARFFLKQETGKRILYLNLPDGSDELNTIWQTDEYDCTVPDLEVSIDVESLYTAIRLLNKNPGILHSISAKCGADSFGFEGKLRYERLDVKPFPINSFSYYLEFYNDWTGTLYELDLSSFLEDFFGECDPESKLQACLRQHLCLK